ncbi:tetratricopeptide repeat protein [Polyangium sorediatum]|uniref:Tetratricopeptide repeat protein n=1 Tax=Polyangium sorediatum TaxID=889274 RepID=A0ABT6P111_9BACT|nr:tetratricopeptide repeat protein [Polyangium sorediatum]MDI1434284.1 tetratricopeptide repeat protein [Polyangium sorediatum]
MKRASRHALGIGLAVLTSAAAVSLAPPASACGPYPPPRVLSPADKAQAQKLFQEGRALEGEGKLERALDRYLASRDLFPRKSNTKNAAVCLDKLGRAAEAIPLYEEVLDRFRSELTPEEQKALIDDVRRLRELVATLHVVDGQGSLFIDGKDLGALPRPCPLYLPAGRHTVRVNRRAVLLDHDLPAGESLRIVVGAEQPPPTPARSEGWFAQAFGGPALGSSMDSNAERDAQNACSNHCPFASGFLTGARGGYITANNVSVELFTGFFSVESTFERTITRDVPVSDGLSTVTYTLSHDLSLRGPFMGPAVGYRVDLGPRWTALFRGSLGLVAAQSSDPVSGVGRDDRGHASPLLFSGTSTVLRSAPTFFMPELGIEAKIGGVRVGLSLGYVLFLAQGNVFNGRAFDAQAACPPTGDDAVACAPETPADVSGQGLQTAHGLMQLWIPQLTFGFLP